MPIKDALWHPWLKVLPSVLHTAGATVFVHMSACELSEWTYFYLNDRILHFTVFYLVFHVCVWMCGMCVCVSSTIVTDAPMKRVGIHWDGMVSQIYLCRVKGNPVTGRYIDVYSLRTGVQSLRFSLRHTVSWECDFIFSFFDMVVIELDLLFSLVNHFSYIFDCSSTLKDGILNSDRDSLTISIPLTRICVHQRGFKSVYANCANGGGS